MTIVDLPPIAFLDDFEQVEALLVGQRMRCEVIKDEKLHAGKLVEQPRKAAIETGEREILEQPRSANVKDGMIEPGGLASDCAGQP